MTTTLRRRNSDVRHVNIGAQMRAGDTDDAAGICEITGYGVVFGERNSYGEIFVPGAFDETLQHFRDTGNPLPMLDGHRQAVGQWTEYEGDATGLNLTGPISDTQPGRDLATLLRDGAVNGLSIGFLPEMEIFAEPGETVAFDTPFGRWTSIATAYTWYVLRARLAEVSVVAFPSGDTARILAVRSAATVTPDRVAVAMPGVREGATWDDIAWSMARLMGAPGAGLSDLSPSERGALHARLARAYDRHGNTPPPFTPEPQYRQVPFQHDEPTLYADRSLRKRCADVTAGAGALDRPLSDETRDAATEARDAITRLLDEQAPAENDPVDTEALERAQQSLHASLEELRAGLAALRSFNPTQQED